MNKENETLWSFYSAFCRYMAAKAKYLNTSYKGDAAKAVLAAEGELEVALRELGPYVEKRSLKGAGA